MHSVMIVDDEYMILKGMAKVVDWQANGFEIVQTARNGQQALTAFKQRPVDLVITDVRMPGSTGLELMQQLHAQPNAPLVIVLSGYQEFDYVKEALRYGAIDYLVKPIDAEELVKVLQKAHQRLDQQVKIDATKRYYLEMQTERLVAGDLPAAQSAEVLASAGVTANEDQFTVLAATSCTTLKRLVTPVRNNSNSFFIVVRTS